MYTYIVCVCVPCLQRPNIICKNIKNLNKIANIGKKHKAMETAEEDII